MFTSVDLSVSSSVACLFVSSTVIYFSSVPSFVYLVFDRFRLLNPFSIRFVIRFVISVSHFHPFILFSFILSFMYIFFSAITSFLNQFLNHLLIFIHPFGHPVLFPTWHGWRLSCVAKLHLSPSFISSCLLKFPRHSQASSFRPGCACIGGGRERHEGGGGGRVKHC